MARAPKSRYRGVWWDRWHGRWAAGVYQPGPQRRKLRVAHFDDEYEAAIARDRVILHMRGPASARNFPRRRLAPASIEQIREQLRRRAKLRRTSRFKGVYRRKRAASARPWYAETRVAGRLVFVGAWASERDAALAHDRAALYYGCARSSLNFPRMARRLRPASVEALRAECERARNEQTSSRFRGVTWLEKQRCWRARITVGGELCHLGVFADDVEAARAYDEAAARAFGKRARFNLRESREVSARTRK